VDFIDDAMILERAKQLCEEAGTAWDRASAATPTTRVLSARDKREYLMRAREQLLNEAGYATRPPRPEAPR
jgi:hypothetical protein